MFCFSWSISAKRWAFPGWLISSTGNVLGYDVEDTYFYIDPEADANILPDYISFDIFLYDDENTSTWVEIKGFFRPWGADFEDFYDVSESDLPYIYGTVQANYADMFPFCYDDWYVPQMNDKFPGLYAIEGANDWQTVPDKQNTTAWSDSRLLQAGSFLFSVHKYYLRIGINFVQFYMYADNRSRLYAGSEIRKSYTGGE